MDFGPLQMLQLMHTTYATNITALPNVTEPLVAVPVEPIAPVPFVPNDYDDIWCRNPQGDKVEWFLMYKVPATTISRNNVDSISTGVQYGYIDSATKLDNLVRMPIYEDIASTKENALYNTLEILFKMQRGFLFEKNITFMSYSDKPPASVTNSSSNGISKGVLLFGQKSGVWLTHTLDGFGKYFNGTYEFPEDARRDAQMAFCMSLAVSNWPKITSHLRRETPNIYDWNVPPFVFDANPDLKLLIEKNHNHGEPGAETNIFTGVNGTDFMGFSKNAIHNYDIYETLIGPGVEANIFLRGTQNGGEQRLENFCNDFNISEVEEVELKLGKDVVVKDIRRSQDNSKWAVSERDYWVCLGSVERKKSHLPRGAETFCFQNQPANILLANSIGKFSKCKEVPADIAAKIAAAAPGTEVAVGNETYVRPNYIRPSFEVPRLYYGGLPSFGLGFPFTSILKNPLVVGAAVAGVMHYRHKQQIKKLNAMHALSAGYGGYGGKYSSGLAGIVGSGAPHYGGGYNNYGGGYGSYGGGFPGQYGRNPSPGFAPPPYNAPNYAPPAYSAHNPYPLAPQSSYPTAPHGSYPTAPHGSNPSAPHGSYPTAPHGSYPSAPHGSYPTAPHGSYPSAPHGSYPTAPHGSYPSGNPPPYPTAPHAPQQPAHNPTFNSAKNPVASAPPVSDSTARKATETKTHSASPTPLRTSKPARPVRVEKTVTKTVTSFEAPRHSSASSTSGRRTSSSNRSSGRSRGGSRGGSRGRG